MTAPDLGTSLILISAGAVITLGGTLLTDYLRGRRDRQLDREAREAEAADKRHAAGLIEAREVHDRLLTLAEQHTGIALSDDRQGEQALIEAVRSRYLLIPDVTVRSALAMTLTIITSSESRKARTDWIRAARAGAFVTAAYIRGEELPSLYLGQLRDLGLIYGPLPADDGVRH